MTTLFAILVLAQHQRAPGTTWKRTEHGAKITLPTGVLQVEAISHNAVRVRFSKDGLIKNQRVPTIVSTDWPGFTSQKFSGPNAKLSTDKIQVVFDGKTQTLKFSSPQGVFLSEEPGTRTAFHLKPGEAIYGLGQHQDGLLDYRGSLVTLEQVNREIAIPFLIDSSGYGLLWNNPAHTNVNVAMAERALPATAEQDEQGQPGKLTVRYFTGEHFNKFVGSGSEAKIDHEWSNSRPMDLPKEHFSVRWTGFITAPDTGAYVFKTISDDGVRLFIDDKPVIDNWEVHAPTLNLAKVQMTAKSRHKLRLEYFQSAGGAEIRMTCGIQQPNNSLKFDSEVSDGVDYCVFYGPSIDQVMKEYRHATGEAPLPPKTALGYWQSKERYASQKDWTDIASEYRRRKHPIDNLVQDWFYWDPWPWGSHKFDPNRYPDPALGIAELHNDFHLQFMISVWGKFIPGSDEYPNANMDAMLAKGYLYPGIGSNERYYDAFNPQARELYWQQMRDQIFKLGVDAWWLDASEPEVYMHDFRTVQTAVGPAAYVLNAWPLMHTVGVSQGQLKAAPDKRVFILTRSAYAGQQRTGAACWSGDISASWEVYANQIPAGLNFCLSGIPYWTTDIGAFFVPGNRYPKRAADPGYRELFTRWFEYGAFCPIFRVHGTDFAKEMWRFGPETEKILNKYDELRYRLMPYIYSQAWQVTAHGGTMMRALVMDFPQDKTAREKKDEFMFGPSLLVCPVIQPGAHSRSVYLPAGTSWQDFWTGTRYQGGQTIEADAPIDKMPLYLKAGSILPMGPVMQYVDEKPADPLEIQITPGANGTFTLYEDTGRDNGYRKGQYSTIPFTWDDKSGKLKIGKRTGAYPGMLKTRTFKIKIGKTTQTIHYNGT